MSTISEPIYRLGHIATCVWDNIAVLAPGTWWSHLAYEHATAPLRSSEAMRYQETPRTARVPHGVGKRQPAMQTDADRSFEQVIAVFQGRGNPFTLPFFIEAQNLFKDVEPHRALQDEGSPHTTAFTCMNGEHFLDQLDGQAIHHDVRHIYLKLELARANRRKMNGISLADINDGRPLHVVFHEHPLTSEVINEEMAAMTFSDAIQRYKTAQASETMECIPSCRAALTGRELQTYQLLRDMAFYVAKLAAKETITAQEKTEFDARWAALKNAGFPLERYDDYQMLYHILCEELDAVAPFVHTVSAAYAPDLAS